MVKISRITIYPFKSLDGMILDQAELNPSGSLKNDRLFALTDGSGKILNAKRDERIHLLESSYDLASNRIQIRKRDEGAFEQFDLTHDIPELEQWLSLFFDQEIKLKKNSESGFPDDTDSTGPTIISTATLKKVADWFQISDLDEVRNRFRANIEIEGCEAFWEDQLYDDLNHVIRFQMGELEWLGVNPCARCVVPTRSPVTGERIPGFQKTLTEQREESLPQNVSRQRWNHAYRLAVNTKPPRHFEGGNLSTGDELKYLGPEPNMDSN